jgi:hypothetical protein
MRITRENKKEKTDLLIEALQYREHLLSGIYDQDGVHGEVTGGQDNKIPLVKKENVKLTKTGDENDGPVIPVGDGERGKGGRYGGDGEAPGYEDGGDHSVLVNPEGSETKVREGPIRPQLNQISYPFGEKREMAFITENGMCFNWNTYWPQTARAHQATGKDWRYLVAPVYAQALTNFDRETIDKEMDLVAWQQRYANYMKFMVDKR